MRAVGGSPVEVGGFASRSKSSRSGDDDGGDGGRGIKAIMPRTEVPTADYSVWTLPGVPPVPCDGETPEIWTREGLIER
jgi:hypothetical protein